jgi:prolyl oligopeptidase
MQNDDYLWLEALDDPKVTDWVNQQNAITEQRFEGTDLFKALHQEQEELMTAEDRTAFGRYFQGWYWNFWQDQNHEKGLWRRCTPEEYRKEKPAWETILDIDALAAEEGKDWVYRYASKFSYTSSRRMLWLSEGGGDARVAREFDTETKSFVDGGFFLPAAKSDIVAVDEDNLLVSTDFGPGSLTESGYPRTVRLWKRGTDLMDAPIILEGREKDLVVDMHKWTQGETETIMVYRAMDFYHQEYSIWDPDTGDLKKIIAPTSLQLGQVIDHWIYGKCQEGVEISGKIIPADTVFRFHLDQGIAASLEVIFKPNHNQAITDFQITFDHQVYLTILQDITSRILLVQKREAQWLVEELPFPKNSNMHFSLADENDPGAKTELYVTSHLEPYSKYHVDQQCGLHLIKRSKPRFDSSKLAVSQNFALSKDGTKVPYFLLESKAAERAGSAPTLLYGYGGFNIKLSPSYNPSVGKSWLERGGTYVVANIRAVGNTGRLGIRRP